MKFRSGQVRWLESSSLVRVVARLAKTVMVYLIVVKAYSLGKVESWTLFPKNIR